MKWRSAWVIHTIAEITYHTLMVKGAKTQIRSKNILRLNLCYQVKFGLTSGLRLNLGLSTFA